MATPFEIARDALFGEPVGTRINPSKNIMLQAFEAFQNALDVQGKYTTIAELNSSPAPDDRTVMIVAGRDGFGDAADYRRAIYMVADLSAMVSQDEVTPGMGDGGTYIAPSNDRTGASGAYIVDYENDLNPYLYGATGDGNDQDAPGLNRTLEALVRRGGGRMRIREGSYLIDTSVRAILSNGDYEIVFDPNSKIIGDLGITEPAMLLERSSSAVVNPTGKLKIINPCIDMSQGVHTSAAQTPSGIETAYWKQVHMIGGDISAGDDGLAPNGDLGYVSRGNTSELIEGTDFSGWNDAGAQPGGDETGGVAGDGSISTFENCNFRNCLVAVTPRRQLRLVNVLGGVVEDCVAGVTTVPVNGQGGAREMNVSDMTFRRVTANIVRHATGSTGSFKDNFVFDFGFLPNGNGVGVNAVAVTVSGSRDIEVSNNVFAMVDLAIQDQRVFRVEDFNDQGVVNTPNRISGHGNDFRNIPRVFVVTASTGALTFTNNFVNADLASLVTGMTSDDLFEYTVKGQRLRRVKRGQNDGVIPFQLNLSAIGSVPAGGVSAAQDFSLAGVSNAYEIANLTRVSDIIANPNVTVSVQPIAGSLRVRVANNTNAAMNMTNQIIRGRANLP